MRIKLTQLRTPGADATPSRAAAVAGVLPHTLRGTEIRTVGWHLRRRWFPLVLRMVVNNHRTGRNCWRLTSARHARLVAAHAAVGRGVLNLDARRGNAPQLALVDGHVVVFYAERRPGEKWRNWQRTFSPAGGTPARIGGR